MSQSPCPISGYPDRINSSGLLELLKRLGIVLQLADATALFTIFQWNSFNPVGNPHSPRSQKVQNSVHIKDLAHWLGSLGSYRYLQKKFQV